MILSAIILHCQQRFKSERSITAIYHLLTGKQSIQTIQDAHLYQLERYYAIYPSMKREHFEQKLAELKNEKLIIQNDANEYKITSSGRQYIAELNLSSYHLNGMGYRQIDQIFYDRLLLMIQVWTNSNKDNYKYIPIIENELVLQWIKGYYRKHKHEISIMLQQLYDELTTILSFLPTEYPLLFIHQLTTYRHIGLTNDQLAIKLKKSASDIYFMEKNLVHFMIYKIMKEREEFPLLFPFLTDVYHDKKAKTFTRSAQITYQLVNEGFSLPEIANRRNLKINTIYDHIVEIAIQDEYFPINHYLNEENKEQIFLAVRKTDSYKLKEIKEEVNDSITYFQIRLALAKLKHEYGD